MLRRLLLLLLLATCTSLRTSAIFFRTLGMTDGLSQLSVLSIYQDRLGRMWFGTEEGLNIYDGNRIIAYKPGDYRTTDGQVVGNKIFNITGDTAGNVYFNADHALYRYDLTTQQVHRITQGGTYALYAQGDSIWVSRNDSVCVYDSRNQQFQLAYRLPRTGLNANVLLIDSRQRCWTGTADGLYLREGEQPLHHLLPGEGITALYEDSHQRLWIATASNGLYLRETDGRLTHFTHSPHEGTHQLADNQVREITEDNQGNLWIGTFLGLNKFNPRNGQFTTYRSDNRPGSLSHSSVFPLYKDRQGTLWIGTYYGGVNYCNPEADLFSFYSADASSDQCLSYPFVGQMVEDKDGNVWIGTEGGGMNFLNRHTRTFSHFTAQDSGNAIAHNNVKTVIYDDRLHRLYIGTHTGGLCIYDIRSGRFTNLYQLHPDYASRFGDRIHHQELHGDTLLFSSQAGIFKMNVHTLQILPFLPYHKYYGNTCFLTDREGYIWVSAGKGIYRVNLADEKDLRYYRYDQDGLGHFAVEHLLEDHKGRLFLGTKGSGVFRFDPTSGTFHSLNTDHKQVSGAYCYGLAESVTGHLLITSDQGLSVYDADNGQCQLVELNEALPLTGINAGCGLLVCHDGEIFVGGTNGLATFYGQLLPQRRQKGHQIYFSELHINNEQVHPAAPASLLEKAIYLSEELELDYDENDLTLEFATNDYIVPLQRPLYEYKISGLDHKWTTTRYHKIHYTHLQPGSYTLHLREKATDLYPQPLAIQLRLIVHPPFYASPLAYLAYTVTVLAVIIGIFRFKQSQFRLRTSLEMEKRDKERIEELTQAKLQFFANISHEFRTPLTLVISQLDLLMQNNNLPATIYNKVVKVYRNTYHLRNLITELLDFRKLEQGHVRLKVTELDLIPFLQEIYLTFTEYAQSRRIRYEYHHEPAVLPCWFDPQQMEKVVYNLLSNAFKYTPDGGSIELNASETEAEVLIKVIDNGIGIQKDDLDKIFERFYQAGNRIADIARTPSTGIGLALVKNVTELHHGTVKVESVPDYGSIFIVRLRKGRAHFSDDDCAQPVCTPPAASSAFLSDYRKELAPATGAEEETPAPTATAPAHSILIAEDNEELLTLLAGLFAPLYQVTLAHNGQEALELVRMREYDLVLSDIMMPELSGTDLCIRLKNDLSTCHIPVVLLTALGTTEQSITGLKLGADEYISKPFNTDMLLARCNNLVRNRRRLQQKYQHTEDTSCQLLATNPMDQQFLENVNAVIEKNLDNPDFVIDELASELALSRSAFYSKFKALAGMTPNDFVLHYKLKRAALWLRTQPQQQITDITYKLGFGSPRYFTRCFKTQFGMTPSDYRKKSLPATTEGQ